MTFVELMDRWQEQPWGQGSTGTQPERFNRAGTEVAHDGR